MISVFPWIDSQGATASQLPPLVLAYVGDSVYEIFVRSKLAQSVSGGVHRLHMAATGYSRCSSQADVVHSILDGLSEQERDIVRRGRNANSGYVPKHADVTEYRYATGFESLLGYLFLSRAFDRLDEVLELAWERVAARRRQDGENKQSE